MTKNKEWQALALHDLESTSMTMSEIARKYGRSERTIEKLQYQHKVVRKFPTRKGNRKRDEHLPLSRQHATLGIRLQMARAGQLPSEFAAKLGISIPTLVGIEHGYHDVKLTQLLKISETTGLRLDELIQTFDKNIYQRSPNARQ